ncbi:ubiquitin C-terminal hydrolase, variant 2 [Coprinopsis cinerea AmutBmut pab1-1]|nr:ubiquitin C-terminal hydrolase, variant 2 [Coprinopsis cinerea AmutBmut pab1-1]
MCDPCDPKCDLELPRDRCWAVSHSVQARDESDVPRDEGPVGNKRPLVPSSSQFTRSVNRPADVRGAINTLATTTLDIEKEKQKEERRKKVAAGKPPPAKKRKGDDAAQDKSKGKSRQEEEEIEQSYHFIGYVPAHGKVWELDGFKSGPLEVGELPAPESPHQSGSDPRNTWMDVVRPALRLKMDKYGGSGDDGSNIQFSLLAIVDDGYQAAFDDLELLKREKVSIEKRMEHNWETKVDLALWEDTITGNDRQALFSFNELDRPALASKRMERDIEIMAMSQGELVTAWNSCVRNIRKAVIVLEDELSKGRRTNTEHINRTFDYEPFFKAFITALHNEGHLNPLLDLDENGKKRRSTTGMKGGQSKR